MGVLGFIPPLAPCLGPKDTEWKPFPKCFKTLGWKVHYTPPAAAVTEKIVRSVHFHWNAKKSQISRSPFPDISWVFSTQMLITHIFHLRISVLVSVELLFWYEYKPNQTLSPQPIAPFWLGSVSVRIHAFLSRRKKIKPCLGSLTLFFPWQHHQA